MEFLKTPLLIKLSVLAFACLLSFYLGRHFSHPQTLVFFTSSSSATAADAGSVAISPNADLKFDLSALIPNQTLTPPPSPPPPPTLAPPPPPSTFGIVDDSGAMKDDFDVGEFDPDLVEKWDLGNETSSGSEESGVGTGARAKVRKYRICDRSMGEYIPCLDNVEEIKRLKSTARGERFERHCPKKPLDCLVLAPKGYKVPIPWPRSRDEV